MKRIKSFILTSLLLLAMAVPIGCAPGKGQYNPTTHIYDKTVEGDPFVVNAQRVRGVALPVFDAFMKIEREQEARLMSLNPAIHTAAEQIRRNGKVWLEDLSKAIATYQSNRTPDGKAKLSTALATVASALDSAQRYIAEARH